MIQILWVYDRPQIKLQYCYPWYLIQLFLKLPNNINKLDRIIHIISDELICSTIVYYYSTVFIGLINIMNLSGVKSPRHFIFLLPFACLLSLHYGIVNGAEMPNSGKTVIMPVEYLPDSTAASGQGDSIEITIVEEDTLLSETNNNTLKENILNLIQGAIFRDTTRIRPPYNLDIINREEDFKPYSGMRISNIYINKVPVVGGTVYDSLSREISAVGKFMNSLHTNTRDWVILNNLIFEVGDTVNSFTLADNERILRSLPFIRDARIVIIPVDSINVVNVGIITRDVFSIGINLNPKSVDDVSFSIFDRNLFGNGWEFRNNFRYRSNLNPSYDYEGIFSINNIMGSFISGTFIYKNAYEVNQIWLNFSKPFLNQETQYAGGLDLMQINQKDENLNYAISLYRAKIQDYWIGRSFLLGNSDARRNIRLGARYYKLYYDRRPFSAADTNVTYHNREVYLGNIIFNQLTYFTGTMISGFGITEDIPVGYALEFTGGLSDEEFKNRTYLGLETRMASWIENVGYLGLIMQLGSYLQSKSWEDGVFHSDFRYFSPLLHLGSYKYRQFFELDYTRGINRTDTKKIILEDESGISGLSHADLQGTERLLFSTQSVAFAPWSLWGFRFTFQAFLNVGWIGMEENPFSQSQFHSSVGVGCRVRNEGLVFRTLHLRFVYYPRVPGGGDDFGFELSTSEPVIFSPFNRGKPRILPFE